MEQSALVFGGGGGKGAYEAGVWQALREIGVERTFSCVIGTSVGALNASLFAQRKLKQAEQIWKTLTPDKILPCNSLDGGALASQKGLKHILLQNLSMMPSDLTTYVCCSKIIGPSLGDTFLGTSLYEQYHPEYICLNSQPRFHQIQYLLASAALPFAYDKVEIDGKYYRDGGIIKEHNLPYRKAAELGYTRVLAVALDNGMTREFSYGSASVMILHPSSSLGTLLSGTLDFDPKNAEYRMKMGYHDAMSIQERIRAFCRKMVLPHSSTGLTKSQRMRAQSAFSIKRHFMK